MTVLQLKATPASNCLGGVKHLPHLIGSKNMTTDVDIDEKIKKITKEPNKYNVIMLNDDATPMEWVMEVLNTIFKHSETTAQALTMSIHNDGSAVVGTYKYEIAEQKSIEAVNASRNHGFPLQLKVEESQ